MTRENLARDIVYQAIEAAGAGLMPWSAANIENRLLRDLIPDFETSGRDFFSDRIVTIAAQRNGIALRFEVPPDATVSGAIMAVAASLPLRLFKCSDKVETHIYEAFGNGKCRIDDSELVELKS